MDVRERKRKAVKGFFYLILGGMNLKKRGCLSFLSSKTANIDFFEIFMYNKIIRRFLLR